MTASRFPEDLRSACARSDRSPAGPSPRSETAGDRSGRELPPPGAPGQSPETSAGAAGRGETPLAPAGFHAIAAAMSEDELERSMRRILKDLPGLLGYHTRDSRRSPGGYPDWTLVGPCGVLFRELKRQGKKPTPAQDEWLAALARAGQNAGVWRPAQLLDGTIARELAAIAGLGGAR